jgi:hypothetical protein
MAMRGLNTDDAALVVTLTRRVGASLRNYRDKGTIPFDQGWPLREI